MDFSFLCKYCNNLFEISFDSISPETRDLIIKVKNKDNEDIPKMKTQITQSTIFSENKIDSSFVKIDRVSFKEIIANLDVILENKICNNCYKKLTKINEIEIKKIEEEISKVDKAKSLMQKEISLNNEVNDKSKKSKIEDSKSQDEATKRLNEDNSSLHEELNRNIEKLKKINEEEEKILEEINNLKIDILLTSRDYELEKSIQQKNQFEQINLLNCNILDSLFDITIKEKYGAINGCKMIYKNYFSLYEIFSGWGHILFLTSIINLKAKKILNISHIKDPYIFYNRGDYSFIYNIIDKKKYLFYERNSNLNDDSKANDLNRSMLYYLQVLKDIDNNMKKVNGNVSGLPNFVINSTSINYYHIELNINTFDDYEWALCMRSLLILLKYYINIITIKENDELKKIIDQKNDN